MWHKATNTLDRPCTDVHIPRRTCLQDLVQLTSSGYRPVANGRSLFHSHQVQFEPMSARFPSGFAPSRMMICFGKTCTPIHSSPDHLDRHLSNPERPWNARWSNRRNWLDHGHHGLCEGYQASKSDLGSRWETHPPNSSPDGGS